MAASVAVFGDDYLNLSNCFDEKIIAFLKNTIQQFYCCNYQYHRLFFLRGIVLEFENILDELNDMLDAKYISWLSSCIIHIRDIRCGYGIRDISYALLVVWYRRFPSEADLVMRRFVYDVGGWSDIKRFLGLWRKLGVGCGCEGEGGVERDGVISRVVTIMIDQLWLDYGVWSRVFEDYIAKREIEGHGFRPQAGDYISFAAKWVPREKSSYSWLYDDFVIAWGSRAGWIRGRHCTDVMNSWRKNFRKIISGLFRELSDSGGESLHFKPLKITNGTPEVFPFSSSRVVTAEDEMGLCPIPNLRRFKSSSYNTGSCGMIEAKDFVRIVYENCCSGGDERGSLVDEAGWRSILDKFCSVVNLAIDTIPVVEFQYDDFGKDDFWRAISYAILISQRGIIGRFMLGSSWIICRREDDIFDIVARIYGCFGRNWGIGSFGGQFDLLAEASEVSGYDCRDKLLYITSSRTHINI